MIYKMKLKYIIQKLKCSIGWHRPGVYGHVINHQVEIDEILREEPIDEDHYNPMYEYYMCCIACDKTMSWDYQYRLAHELKYQRYAPLSLKSKEEVYNQ